jgi:hypothetical protein
MGARVPQPSIVDDFRRRTRIPTFRKKIMQILHRNAFALAAFSIFAISAPASAQRRPRLSQHGTVSQTIANTTITMEYDRPTARGRDLRGQNVIHFGRFWTPGANWATTLEVDEDILVEGQRLAAGKYSVWMIPGDETWTVILNADHRVFHTRRPDADQEAIRFDVAVVDGVHMEALTFHFPEVSGGTTTLNFHWGCFVIPMHLEVAPPSTTR